jgi:hypothetical protein
MSRGRLITTHSLQLVDSGGMIERPPPPSSHDNSWQRCGILKGGTPCVTIGGIGRDAIHYNGGNGETQHDLITDWVNPIHYNGGIGRDANHYKWWAAVRDSKAVRDTKFRKWDHESV